jgi:hypothetical protein
MRSASIERARAIADKVRQRNQRTWDEVDREVVFAIDALVAHAEWLYMRNEQVAAAEREACADICDQQASIEGIAQRCAAAIRARGQA